MRSILAIVKNESFLAATFGAGSALLAMGIAAMLPDGWPTGLMLIGVGLLLLSSYIVLLAETHAESPALIPIRRKRWLILIVAGCLALTMVALGIVGITRHRQMVADLRDAFIDGERLMSRLLSGDDYSTDMRITWEASARDTLGLVRK